MTRGWRLMSFVRLELGLFPQRLRGAPASAARAARRGGHDVGRGRAVARRRARHRRGRPRARPLRRRAAGSPRCPAARGDRAGRRHARPGRASCASSQRSSGVAPREVSGTHVAITTHAGRSSGAPAARSPTWAPRLRFGPMKRYHVTTFGCQMNEHDSERMKGMLESLGYSEAPTRAEADLILFNTCSIREKADDRFIAHLGEAKRLKREDPERIVGVGGCWAQSVKDEVFAQFPFVDVAFGPGQVHKLAEFLTSDSLTAQGFFEFEGFTGHLPASARARSRGGCRSRVGCNCSARTASCRRTRGREVVAAARGARRRGRARSPPTASARSRCSARTSTPTGATCGRSSGDVRRAAARRSTRSTARPHPLHEPAPEGHARGRRSARTPSCRASASTSTCRCSRARAASSRRCAAPTTASATWTASR